MNFTDAQAHFPAIPRFDDNEIESCRKQNDFMPIFFALYRHVGIVCASLVEIKRPQLCVRAIPDSHYYLLIGLLFRLAKLMLSNIALASEQKFGETIAILDRCIYEGAIKLAWLCDTNETQNKFELFFADGLKADLALRNEITANIQSRSGIRLPIEDRMLLSIERSLSLAGMDSHTALQLKKLPTLNSMVKQLGFEDLNYVVGQKIGSQNVHGGWSSLLAYFLTERDGAVFPRDEDIPPHINQFTFNALLVMDACDKYSVYILSDPALRDWISSYLKELKDHMVNLFGIAISQSQAPLLPHSGGVGA